MKSEKKKKNLFSLPLNSLRWCIWAYAPCPEKQSSHTIPSCQFAVSREAATRWGLCVLNVLESWGSAADFLGARLKEQFCAWYHWKLQIYPNKLPCTLAVKPGRFEKIWNFSVNLNCYNKGGKSIVFLMIWWKSLSLTGPLYCFTDAKQEREELNFKKRPPGSPLTLSTVIVHFRHVDRTN